MGRFGSYGDNTRCPVCGYRISVLAYGRHRGSPACKTNRAVGRALEDLKLSSFDAVYDFASLTVRGKQTRALAVGIDADLDAVTVIHTDGAVRQYLSGEWGPTKAKNPSGGCSDGRRHHGIGVWWS